MKLSPTAIQRIAVGVMWGLAGITVGILAFIIGFIFRHGLPHITWTFLTQSPQSMGREGGVLPIIVGTLWVSGLAVLMATRYTEGEGRRLSS